MNSRTAIEGRYPRTVLGTVCVPWTDDYRLDEPLFRSTIAGLAAQLPDLYIFGSAGEGHSVTESQFRRVVDVFAEEMAAASASAPMVGVIGTSLGTVVERIAYGESMGIHSFQISLPSWGALSDAEVMRFFAEVCDRFPDSSFLHYNILSSGRLVRPEQYGELAERHPNLVATKYGAGDPQVLEGLMTHAPQLRHFLSEQGYITACPWGEPALLTSASSANLAGARELLRAGIEGDTRTLERMGGELAQVTRILIESVGPGRSAPAYDKALLKLVFPEFPLRLLPPYEQASEQQFARLRDELARTVPQWLPA